MAMMYTTRVRDIESSISARFLYTLSSIPMAISDHFEKKKTIRSLRALSSHQLEDIGLTRGDIDDMMK